MVQHLFWVTGWPPDYVYNACLASTLLGFKVDVRGLSRSPHSNTLFVLSLYTVGCIENCCLIRFEKQLWLSNDAL